MLADELIIFPDVVDVARAALTLELDRPGRLPGVPMVGRVPSPRPKEFGRIIRAGGTRETRVTENATLLLEAWAQTETRAGEILNLMRAAIFAQDDQIFGATEIGGPNNLPDPTTKQERYTSTVGVRVRGTVSAQTNSA